jgi:hypothetical protein
MFRKEALSDWLKLVTGKIVQQEISIMETNDEIIFSLLSGLLINYNMYIYYLLRNFNRK